MGTAQGDWYVKSVEKAFAVLGTFTEEKPLQSVSEVAAGADLSRAAARRFLLTLAELGYLSTDGARFQLAPRVLNIGSAFLSNLTLPAIAEPHLKSLSADLQETASVCILDDVHVVYVARVTSPGWSAWLSTLARASRHGPPPWAGSSSGHWMKQTLWTASSVRTCAVSLRGRLRPGRLCWPRSMPSASAAGPW